MLSLQLGEESGSGKQALDVRGAEDEGDPEEMADNEFHLPAHTNKTSFGNLGLVV